MPEVKATTFLRGRESARLRRALQRLAHCVIFASILLSSASAAGAPPGEGLHWDEDWRTPGLWDGVSIVAMQASTAAVVFGVGSDRDPFFEGPILFDDALQEPILGDDEESLRFMSGVSDGMWYGLLAWSLVIEPWLIDYAIWDEPEIALRVFVINTQTLSLAAFVSTLQQYFVRRERPPTLECRASAEDPAACTDREIVGFPSGHFLMSATAASLTCLGGDEIGHYGNEFGYWTACLATSGLALAVGVLRTSANAHYPTDSIAGGLMGVAIGYLFPKLSYYDADGSSGMALPWLTSDAGGMVLQSTW